MLLSPAAILRILLVELKRSEPWGQGAASPTEVFSMLNRIAEHSILNTWPNNASWLHKTFAQTRQDERMEDPHQSSHHPASPVAKATKSHPRFGHRIGICIQMSMCRPSWSFVGHCLGIKRLQLSWHVICVICHVMTCCNMSLWPFMTFYDHDYDPWISLIWWGALNPCGKTMGCLQLGTLSYKLQWTLTCFRCSHYCS